MLKVTLGQRPANNRQGPQSFNQKELDSADHMDEFGSEFFPKASKSEAWLTPEV